MAEIFVDGVGRPYKVRVERGLIDNVGTIAAEMGGGKACLVSDQNVNALYGKRVCESLEKSGLSVCHFAFEPGEQSKNISTYSGLVNYLAENRLTRSDWVIALGGGVTGDLAGFAAATYLRGIRLIQVPTTLLASVDSSVGGKTAVDLDWGKNLLGAFYQPDIVLCDPDTLDTLPETEFQNGMAEVIKHSILSDPVLFEQLKAPEGIDIADVIARNVAIKRNVVRQDEKDTGIRQLLNLGHTFGHGIEKSSGYTIPHGRAVAVGISIMARACEIKGLCSKELLNSIQTMLLKYGLPIYTEYSYEDLYSGVLSDKKRASDRINLVLIRDLGRCELRNVSLEEAGEFLRLGLRRDFI